MNFWMKRAIGAAALGGSLLALGAGAQDIDAGRDRGGIRARVREPRLASADAALGTRRARPRATAATQASVTPRSGSATVDTGADTRPRADAEAAASLSRPRLGRPAVHRRRRRPPGPGRRRAAGGGRPGRVGHPARHRRDERR